MKHVALSAIAFLFLLSCASSDSDVIDERSLGCGPGQDIDVMAGIDKNDLEGAGDDRFELLVNVSNNSHEEVIVSWVRAEQPGKDRARYRVESSYRKFDQVLAGGKDFTFHLPMSGTGIGYDPSATRGTDSRDSVQLAVTVGLSNGDLYRCAFDVGTIR